MFPVSLLTRLQKLFSADQSPLGKGSQSWWIPVYFQGPTSADLFNSTKPIWLPGETKDYRPSSDPTIITDGALDFNAGPKDTGIKKVVWLDHFIRSHHTKPIRKKT
uniref:Uncharacterized protein n=1 Tax=Cacopsylla melanoneura TaxID=428564 RepID=A0A8D9AHQ3_9HEMI